MKTRNLFAERILLIVMILALGANTIQAASDKPDAPIKGNSTPEAGEYEVRPSSELFFFQGEAYNVYKVFYDCPSMNMNIAVKEGKKCNSYIAYTGEYTIFYSCSKKGFGASKVMFAKPGAHLCFNPNIFQKQAVLSKKRHLDPEEAIKLIAASLPAMRQDF